MSSRAVPASAGVDAGFFGTWTEVGSVVTGVLDGDGFAAEGAARPEGAAGAEIAGRDARADRAVAVVLRCVRCATGLRGVEGARDARLIAVRGAALARRAAAARRLTTARRRAAARRLTAARRMAVSRR